MNTPTTTSQITAKPPRSRVTSGRTLLDNVDQRSRWVRRCRDLIERHVADLGDDISAAEMSLVRRAAVLNIELEKMEQRFAVADASPAALDSYQRCASSLRRLLESLGIKRRPAVVPKTINAAPINRPLPPTWSSP